MPSCDLNVDKRFVDPMLDISSLGTVVPWLLIEFIDSKFESGPKGEFKEKFPCFSASLEFVLTISSAIFLILFC